MMNEVEYIAPMTTSSSIQPALFTVGTDGAVAIAAHTWGENAAGWIGSIRGAGTGTAPAIAIDGGEPGGPSGRAWAATPRRLASPLMFW